MIGGVKMGNRQRNPRWKDIAINHLLNQQDNTCPYCKEKFTINGKIEIDHILHTRYGGKDTFDNLRILHAVCHKKRHYPERKFLSALKKINARGKYQIKIIAIF